MARSDGPLNEPQRFFTRLKAVPLARGLRVACSNALRTILSLGTLACCASLSRRASSFSGMLQVSVATPLPVAHPKPDAMLRLKGLLGADVETAFAEGGRGVDSFVKFARGNHFPFRLAKSRAHPFFATFTEVLNVRNKQGASRRRGRTDCNCETHARFFATTS